MIKKYEASNIHPVTTDRPIMVHDGFVEILDKMNAIAKALGIRIYVTSSFRTSTIVPGAIVEPAKMSNHMIGHAIDCNVQIGSVWYNSKAMAQPKGVLLDFILQCEALDIRWGGRFNTPDPVHFDDGLNIRHPDMWHQIYNTLT
jgi:hypothetical protein